MLENCVIYAQKKKPEENRFPSLTKGHTVYHAIRRAILLREIDAGAPLTEQQVGQEFNCSQGTVREALMRLQEEGLVQRRGYRGTSISRSSLAEVVQMAEIRIKLEVEGINHSAKLLKDKDIIGFENHLNEMDNAVESDDSYAFSELDRLFHLEIFRCSGLQALEPILTRCMLHMHLQTFGHPREGVVRELPTAAHAPIMDGLRQRDAVKATDAMRKHILTTIRRWSPPLDSAMSSARVPNRIDRIGGQS
ncbi:MAG: GntR family transcriptional regulator [Rhizobiaceae bacterium]